MNILPWDEDDAFNVLMQHLQPLSNRKTLQIKKWDEGDAF